MDTGIQLGRRFRALKLWMVLRHFGAEGLRQHLAEHMRLARLAAAWIDADPDMERLAPVPFSVVCFRLHPSRKPGSAATRRPGETPWSEAELEALNQRAMDAVNAGGEVFLSHTRLDGRFTLRLAIGHLDTTESHVRRAVDLLRAQIRHAP